MSTISQFAQTRLVTCRVHPTQNKKTTMTTTTTKKKNNISRRHPPQQSETKAWVQDGNDNKKTRRPMEIFFRAQKLFPVFHPNSDFQAIHDGLAAMSQQTRTSPSLYTVAHPGFLFVAFLETQTKLSSFRRDIPYSQARSTFIDNNDNTTDTVLG